jgi:hypothetical protein
MALTLCFALWSGASREKGRQAQTALTQGHLEASAWLE